MELRTGTFETSLDEKSRISIPARVREWYPGELVLTRGMEPSVWIMTPETWEKFSKRLEGCEDLSVEEYQSLQYQHILSAQMGEIDKTGRILIPPTLRKYARLSHECLVMSAENHLEIWDAEFYSGFLEENRSLYQGAMRKLGSGRLFKINGD
jgi:MraZ protein